MLTRWPVFCATQTLLMLGACTDYQLRKQKPELSLSAAYMNFGEVVVGTQRTGTLTVSNDGAGDLHLDRVDLSGDDFLLIASPAGTLAPGDSADLSVRYAPAETGPDEGSVLLASDDPTEPEKLVTLVGSGVQPEIDLDPETLWFGDVAVGDSATLSVDVNARGVGDLRVTAIEFAGSEADAFAISLPSSVSLPTTLSPGTGFSFDVSFSPPTTDTWDGTLVVRSNDPDNPDAPVRLLGNVVSTGEAAPIAEITSPDWGQYLSLGETVTLRGVVVDDADAPSDLAALWYADGSLLGASTPDSAGLVSLDTSALPEGTITLRLAAIDSLGNVGDDEVEVTVVDPEQPVNYVLSGGSSIFDYWSVDDDVTITLDGSPVLLDEDHQKDDHAPFEISARPGQTLRIVATDYKYCDRVLDGLVLHWGTTSSQDLNEDVCRSACEDHACYDPDFAGPWPQSFVDESFVISIP